MVRLKIVAQRMLQNTVLIIDVVFLLFDVTSVEGGAYFHFCNTIVKRHIGQFNLCYALFCAFFGLLFSIASLAIFNGRLSKTHMKRDLYPCGHKTRIQNLANVGFQDQLWIFIALKI